MKNISDKLMDYYIRNALTIDVFLVVVVWILNSTICLFNFKINAKSENINILSNLISASLSLAGFILAALTIIAAMRSNIINKPPEAARNPLELFFSSENYKTIVKVFQGSIIELTFTFITAFVAWINKENLSDNVLFKILVSLLILTSISVLRSLIVLFKIIGIKDTRTP